MESWKIEEMHRRYHQYMEAFYSFFGITREMKREMLDFTIDKRPCWWRICCLAMYWATDVLPERHAEWGASFEYSFKSQILVECPPTLEDYKKAIDFLNYVGLTEYEMQVMRFCSASAVSTSYRL